MSHVIECPACSTRYKLNKPIPEEGRFVKCARCAHQWRLVPEAPDDEALELEEAQYDQPAEQPSQPAEHHDVFMRRTPDSEAPAGSADIFGDDQSDDDSARDLAARFSAGVAAPAGDLDAAQAEDFKFPASFEDRSWRQTAEEADDEQAEEADDPAPEKPSPLTDWRARRDQYSAAISTLSDPSSVDYDSDATTTSDPDEAVAPEEESPRAFDDPDEPDGDLAMKRWPGFDEAADEPFKESSADTYDRYDYDESGYKDEFDRSDIAMFEPEEKQEEQPRKGWAKRLFGFGRSKAKDEPTVQDEEPVTEERTESAIRKALNAALEHPDDMGANQGAYDDHFARRIDEPETQRRQDDDAEPEYELESYQRDEDPEPRFPLGFKPEPEEENEPAPRESTPAFSFADFDQLGESRQSKDGDDGEPPFRLTGENAKKPVFGLADDESDDDRAASQPDERFDTAAFQSDFDDAFGRDESFEAPSSDKTSKQHDAYDDIEEDFGALYDRQFAGNGHDRTPNDALEEDLALLQSELESTDVTTVERDHAHGGLAIAAAWAVFISVISGVMLAIVTFRQEIMIALPGTTGLYQGLGFTVASAANVDFADVNYRWTTADGKPMIEVTGQVVNLTAETVKVPRVLVNVRDTVGSDSVQATASVPRSELAPRERASFSLEFLSPPENVAQIELEFDRTQ